MASRKLPSSIPVISNVLVLEVRPATIRICELGFLNFLENHQAISRFAFPLTGGALTRISKLPSISSWSLVSLAFGTTCTTIRIPFSVFVIDCFKSSILLSSVCCSVGSYSGTRVGFLKSLCTRNPNLKRLPVHFLFSSLYPEMC